MPEPKVIAVTVCGGIALIFAIAAMATPEGIVIDATNPSSAGFQSSHSGPFRNKLDYGAGGSTSEKVKCSDLTSDTKCEKALKNKCGTIQAFAIIGVFATIATLPVGFIDIPKLIGCAAAAVAAFSHMIIWTIYAHLANSDFDFTSANCGYKSAVTDPKIGASAALYILCWMLSIGQAVLFFLIGAGGK